MNMPENIGLLILLAFLTDLSLGDPRWMPHPVVLMGKCIEFLESILRPIARNPQSQLVAGALLTVTLVGGSWALTYYLLQWALQINLWFGSILSVWLIFTTIAAQGLAQAAWEIYHLLQKGDLTQARQKVGWIVGRDTDNLDAGGITRATVETVSENIVDGIIAPLFYALIGGAPLAVAYRAVNTLDSMLGYKNERYLYFGRASARLDDLANYLPARITGLILLAAVFLLRMDSRRACKTMLRDSSSHPSPNSGIPESVVAGALGIRLGGLNHYYGRQSFRPYMGDDLTPLAPEHIKQTIRIMYLTSFLTVVSIVIISIKF